MHSDNNVISTYPWICFYFNLEAIKHLDYGRHDFWGIVQKYDLINVHKLCLTGGDRAHHHSAEFDDGAEDVFGLSGARQILTVAF